jgi:hypothetical protein
MNKYLDKHNEIMNNYYLNKHNNRMTGPNLEFTKAVISKTMDINIRKEVLRAGFKPARQDALADMQKHIENNPRFAEHIASIARRYHGQKLDGSALTAAIQKEMAEATNLFPEIYAQFDGKVEEGKTEEVREAEAVKVETPEKAAEKAVEEAVHEAEVGPSGTDNPGSETAT